MKRRTQIATAILVATLISAVIPGIAQAAGTVNVNSADATQLSMLPRVGPAIAQRIIEYRDANGRFKSVDDLMLVRGIGEKTFELMKPYVAVEGASTLTEKVPSAQKKSTEDK